MRLHDLRHSFASLAASKGHSLLMIGKLLGHRVPSTTQRYAHLTREAASTVADELGGAITAAIAQTPAVELDGGEAQGPEAPMSNGFSYTEEQWNDIANSLSALKETSEADLAQLRMELLWSINIPLLTDDHIRDGYRENAAAAQDALRTIRKLVKSIGHRRHNPGDDVGRSVQQTLPHLFRIYRSAQADIRRSRAVSAGARARIRNLKFAGCWQPSPMHGRVSVERSVTDARIANSSRRAPSHLSKVSR